MSRLVVGPFNRVEGDLEVSLNIRDGRVDNARVTAPLYRGFEQILEGRPLGDALVVAPRVCGICSVSHSVAASRALADLSGATPPANGRLTTDLVLACENVADHLTHFHLFFMPDFARETYAGRPWHGAVAEGFRATRGRAQAGFLAARARFLHLLGLLAGKWPHSLAIQPGGTTRAVTRGERPRLRAVLRDFRRFLESELFACPLDAVAELSDLAALEAWAAQDGGSLPLFLRLAFDLKLQDLGRGSGRFMSAGSFAGPEGPLFAPGLWEAGEVAPLDPAAIVEDVTHAWMAENGGPHHPADGTTLPDADKAEGYSWAKAPRLDGRPVEVGALARQVVDGQPLARAMAADWGGGVTARIIARMIEVARLIRAMEDWVETLAPEEPFWTQPPPAGTGRGVGLVEAARGTLGHWLAADGGRIRRYQIVSPTTWNFSPRDAQGIPGPLERALEGTPVEPGADSPVAVQHVVRSFDPCMGCTVH